MNKDVVLSVRDMEVTFGTGNKKFVAVRGVSFDVYRGETLGLVGESGSGKTTIGRTIIRVNPTSRGEIYFNGTKINGRISRKLDKQIVSEIQMVFQDPMASLNDRAKVDYIVSEGLRNVNKSISEDGRRKKVAETLSEVGLLPEFASRFPHEFSGGQRQRIGIARALIMEPSFIIADEPISALDVSIRAQVLNLLSKLQKERNLTSIFISHDLAVMRYTADRIAVLHKGVLVELAETESLFKNPLHPYTRALLSAVPLPNPKEEKRKKLLVYDSDGHDYGDEKPLWEEVEPNHFVLGSAKEMEVYRNRLAKNNG